MYMGAMCQQGELILNANWGHRGKSKAELCKLDKKLGIDGPNCRLTARMNYKRTSRTYLLKFAQIKK